MIAAKGPAPSGLQRNPCNCLPPLGKTTSSGLAWATHTHLATENSSRAHRSGFMCCINESSLASLSRPTAPSGKKEIKVHLLGRHDSKAHIHRLGRVGQQSNGNEIHAGLGVGANILQPDSAGTLERNAVFEVSTALDGAAHIFWRHVVE